MKKFFVILSLFLLSNAALHSQNPEWIAFPFDSIGVSHGTVNSIAIDSTDNIWFTSNNYYIEGRGVFKFDGMNFTVFDTTNSDLQNNHVYTLCVDKDNNLWAGHAYYNNLNYFSGGISKYENYSFKKISPDKMLYDEPIYDIDVDLNGNVWLIGILSLLKYDTKNWTIWNPEINPEIWGWDFPLTLTTTANNEVWFSTYTKDEMSHGTYRGLMIFRADTFQYFRLDDPPGQVNDLIADLSNNIWACVDQYSNRGLWLIQDTNLINYNNGNFGIPCDSVNTIAIDKENNKWLGTARGLIKWDGITWTHWHTGNSYIPFNKIYSIEIDRQGNIWLGGSNYLAVFREGGVILKTEDNTQNKSESVNCYPNPFSESTIIKYYLDKPDFVNLTVYDALGQKITVLVDSFINEGEQQINFEAGNLTYGIYYFKLIIADKAEFGKMILIR